MVISDLDLVTYINTTQINAYNFNVPQVFVIYGFYR